MSINQAESDRLRELADFLRSRRARLLPEQVGLPNGMRRRTPGLRRGEVAMLAGITPEWYTRLEQGQDIRVSVQLLESLARVLQLDANERTHLFLLALRQPPPVETFAQRAVSPALQNFLDQLTTTPACVFDPRLNILSWNAAYATTFSAFTGDPTTVSARDRNMVWRVFTSPFLDHSSEEWQELARLCLGHFRAEYGRFIDDPWWSEQIAELNRVSPEFRTLWARHDIPNDSEGRKSMRHALVGDLDFDILWLQTVDAGDLRLLLYTPRPGTDTARKIERLMALESAEAAQ